MKLRRLISDSTKESRGLPACRHCMVIASIASPRNSGNSLRRIGVPCGYDETLLYFASL
jgi:hypothetical protein